MNETLKREVLLYVGAEGGSIKLYGVRTNDGWLYQKDMVDQTPLMLDDKEIRHSSAFTSSWKEALELLDRNRWQRLSPIRVHPEFRQAIWAAVQQRYTGDDPEKIWSAGVTAVASRLSAPCAPSPYNLPGLIRSFEDDTALKAITLVLGKVAPVLGIIRYHQGFAINCTAPPLMATSKWAKAWCWPPRAASCLPPNTPHPLPKGTYCVEGRHRAAVALRFGSSTLRRIKGVAQATF